MYDREIYASPYETFRRLRNEAPLYYNEKYDFYAVSRHDDLARVLGDRDTYISGKGNVFNIINQNMEVPPGLFIAEDQPQPLDASRHRLPAVHAASSVRPGAADPRTLRRRSSTTSSGATTSTSCKTSR